MKIISNPQEMQKVLKSQTETLGFVPTLGGLHQGHLALIEKAKKENQKTLVSLFLNPTQFNQEKDLKTYPSSTEKDLEILREQKVNYVFTPSFAEIYPDNYNYQVQETNFSQELCGKDRPGHFEGVLTIVLKLLNIVNPSKAYFGEKDFQQLQLIKGMVQAFFLPVEIMSHPIVRDNQGLALSTRNRKLSPAGLKKAHFFAATLQSKKSLQEIFKIFEDEEIEIDYLEERNQRRFAAVKIEDVRLIDNVSI